MSVERKISPNSVFYTQKSMLCVLICVIKPAKIIVLHSKQFNTHHRKIAAALGQLAALPELMPVLCLL